MNINRQNYEVILIDYLDGKLSPSQTAELMAFLEKHSDIQEELEGLKDAVLVDESVSFPNKSELKKNGFLKNGINTEFNYLCISSLEGDITLAEKQNLEALIKQEPNKLRELSAFQKTILNPDAGVVYSKKDSLKRSRVVPIRVSSLKMVMGIAASFTLILSVYTLYNLTNDTKSITDDSKMIVPIAASTSKVKEIEKILPEAKLNKGFTKVDAQNYEKLISPSKETTIVEIKSSSNHEELPSIINRIDPKVITANINHRDEQVALALLASYNYTPVSSPANNPILLGYVNKYNTREIGVFDIIQYGIKSFGKLIGRDVKLEADKDKNGNIQKVHFESNLFAFSAPIRKKE